MIRLLEIFGAGIIAAYVMFLTNWFAYERGWVRVSVVEAFNDFISNLQWPRLAKVMPSAFHRTRAQGVQTPPRIPRTLLRLFMGGVFALIYSAFVAALPIHSMWAIMTMCIVLGFVHGFGVGTMDAILVAESHPVSVYRKFGHQVIFTHLSSHMIFGITLGFMFSMLAAA